MFKILLSFAASLIIGLSPVQAQSIYSASETGRQIPRMPYVEYETLDRFDRLIRFYLSETLSEESELPLVVYVQGSSTGSQFLLRNERMSGNNGHLSVSDVVRGRARLLIVEKPGVEYLDNPPGGSAAQASSSFRQEHTLDRWTEAVVAAIKASLRLPDIQPERVLVAGHSEGGIVAANVARNLESVSHIALLAGGGPTQLFSIIELARQGQFFGHISEDPDERVDYVLDSWQRISDSPYEADSIFFGHSFKRWHSFLSSSPIELLSSSEDRIFVAQGTADVAVPVSSFDMLCAQLISQGLAPECLRMDGADHSFRDVNTSEDRWTEVWSVIVDWFLE